MLNVMHHCLQQDGSKPGNNPYDDADNDQEVFVADVAETPGIYFFKQIRKLHRAKILNYNRVKDFSVPLFANKKYGIFPMCE
jgi:hypothetical protein